MFPGDAKTSGIVKLQMTIQLCLHAQVFSTRKTEGPTPEAVIVPEQELKPSNMRKKNQRVGCQLKTAPTVLLLLYNRSSTHEHAPFVAARCYCPLFGHTHLAANPESKAVLHLLASSASNGNQARHS